MRIIPLKPLSTGDKVHILPAVSGLKADYFEFIEENSAYHKPWVYLTASELHFKYYLKSNKSGTTQGCFIYTNDSKKLVGVININNILMGAVSSASLGYYNAEKYSGAGLMAEGMVLVLDYAFKVLGLNRIEANIQPNNLPSIKLVKRLGFRKEGFSPKYLKIGDEFKDHERWAILKDDFYS
jgi:ribosomal-protein-alanine N-acetyltransferase